MSGLRRTITKLQPDEVIVRFSPDVRQSLVALEETVHASSYFDPDIRESLQSMAKGDAITIRGLVAILPLIIKETMNHIHQTGDEKARSALLELNIDLSGRSLTSNPISLETLQRGRAR